ncbi:MAG: hypothetical protein WC457_00890 [Patescibacteria group bacterium]
MLSWFVVSAAILSSLVLVFILILLLKYNSVLSNLFALCVPACIIWLPAITQNTLKLPSIDTQPVSYITLYIVSMLVAYISIIILGVNWIRGIELSVGDKRTIKFAKYFGLAVLQLFLPVSLILLEAINKISTHSVDIDIGPPWTIIHCSIMYLIIPLGFSIYIFFRHAIKENGLIYGYLSAAFAFVNFYFCMYIWAIVHIV